MRVLRLSRRNSGGSRGKRFVGLLAAPALAGILLAITPGAAHASPKLADGVAVPNGGASYSVYKAINISYYANEANPGGPVASCINTGGTCTLSVTESTSTNIVVSLGASKAGIAANLGFSLSRTVSTGASCTSPTLKSGQRYVAYRLGRQAMYRIEHDYGTELASHVDISAWLFSWEPYTGAHIECYVVG